MLIDKEGKGTGLMTNNMNSLKKSAIDYSTHNGVQLNFGNFFSMRKFEKLKSRIKVYSFIFSLIFLGLLVPCVYGLIEEQAILADCDTDTKLMYLWLTHGGADDCHHGGIQCVDPAAHDHGVLRAYGPLFSNLLPNILRDLGLLLPRLRS